MITLSRTALFAALVAASLGMITAAHAQNLLLTNPDFELSGNGSNFSGSATFDNYTDGWTASSSAPGGYFGTTNDANPLNQIPGQQGVAYTYLGGTGLVGTRAGARAVITAGSSYTLTFKAGQDGGTGNFLGSIIWYTQNTVGNYATRLTPATLSFAVASGLTGTYSLSGTAPVGATFAAARFGSTVGSGHRADFARLTAAVVPEAGTVALLGTGLSVLGAVIVKRRK